MFSSCLSDRLQGSPIGCHISAPHQPGYPHIGQQVTFPHPPQLLNKILPVSDAGRTIHSSDPAFNAKLKEATQLLNLKPHMAGLSK